ncbi:hypothetical protein MASR1M12_21840 [Erysipelotrichia bacterium]
MKNFKTWVSKGFMLAEILLAIFILGLTSVSAFYMISASGRETANAYHQLISEQIGQEIIEVFRTIGFNRLSECHDQQIAGYRLNEWQALSDASQSQLITRPAICAAFERKITMQLLEKDGINAILLNVAVRPQRGGQGSAVESNYSTILVEQP